MKGKVRSSGEGERHSIKGLITKDLAFSHAVVIWLNNDKAAMSNDVRNISNVHGPLRINLEVAACPYRKDIQDG